MDRRGFGYRLREIKKDNKKGALSAFFINYALLTKVEHKNNPAAVIHQYELHLKDRCLHHLLVLEMRLSFS